MLTVDFSVFRGHNVSRPKQNTTMKKLVIFKDNKIWAIYSQEMADLAKRNARKMSENGDSIKLQALTQDEINQWEQKESILQKQIFDSLPIDSRIKLAKRNSKRQFVQASPKYKVNDTLAKRVN